MGLNGMTQNVTTLRLVGAVLLFALAMGPALAAGGTSRIEEPLRAEREFHFQLITPPEDVWAALRTGMPTRLAIVESGVNSYQAANPFSTSLFWSDDELLTVLLGFQTASSRLPVRISVDIKDSGGVLVFSLKEWRAFAVNAVVFGEAYVGALAAGAYEVTVRVKQDDKSVGQRYWLVVSPSPGN